MNESGELGIVTIDRAATIQSWNAWLASATGLSEDDVRGRALLSLVAPARSEIVGAFLGEVLSSGTSRVLAPAFHHYLFACPPRELSAHFTEMQQFVTMAPLTSGGGIVGAMITVEDVTPRLDRQRDLMAQLESAAPGLAPAAAIEAVGAGDWRLRGRAVRNLRERASAAEVTHLLDTLRREYNDLNVVSSALQVLAANRDVTSPLIELLADGQPDLRMHAALALGHVGDPVAVPALLTALDDEEPNVRFHAIEALGSIGAGDAVDRLADIARSGDFFLSFPAIAALARADDPRVGPALISLLANDLLRPAVIDTLASIGDEDAVAPLVAVLNGGTDVDGAAAIAAALERIRAREEETFGAGGHIIDLARAALRPSGVAALTAAVDQKRAPLASLISVLGWSGAAGVQAIVRAVGNPDVERAVADAVMGIGRESVEPLIRTLSEGDRAERISAATLLGGLDDRRAVQPLVAALDGADTELTAASAGSLARLGDAAALDPLVRLFGHEQAIVRQAAIAAVNSIGADATASRIRPRLEDADPRVRGCAVRIAGYFGFQECLPGLLRCLEDADDDVRRAAIEQLPVVDDSRAVTLLVEALGREKPRNRAAAAHALRQVAGDVATLGLIGALDDEDAWVRYFAAGALGPRADVEAVSALRRLAQSDPAPHVRIAALQALTSIDPYIAGEIAVPLVRDSDPELAAAALTAVAAGAHPGADDLLDDAVKSGDAFLRRAAVRALPSRSTARAADLLAWAACLADPPDLPRLLIESLSRLAAADDAAARTAAVSALINLASAEETRESALHALAVLPEVVDDLARTLDSTRVATKLTAIEALARMRHPRASQALMRALDDEDAAARRAAVAAFGRLGTRSAAEAIGALSTSDPDERVQRLAAAMCRRHGWPCGAER